MDIDAPAVVLAAGGAGAIYRRHDNQKKILGQGYALAAQAGLDLWDMEFVQFFPLVLADPRLPALIVYPPFAREAKLVDSSGESILEKHGLGDVNEAIVKKRDSFSALLFEEAQAGGVFLDLREVPASAWDVHPLAIFKRLRFNFRGKPVAVAPAVHFTMGGLRTGETCETDIGRPFCLRGDPLGASRGEPDGRQRDDGVCRVGGRCRTSLRPNGPWVKCPFPPAGKSRGSSLWRALCREPVKSGTSCRRSGRRPGSARGL